MRWDELDADVIDGSQQSMARRWLDLQPVPEGVHRPVIDGDQGVRDARWHDQGQSRLLHFLLFVAVNKCRACKNVIWPL